MDLRIALAGNPNCGKTTLFNALTGSNQFVGNWPGVTVEKKEGKLKKHDGVTITDLPGIYSLSPYTLEEVVARNYLIGERPDAILNIIDGTNLERNLYLTTQLTELGIPVVVAINMMDVVKKNGDKIDTAELARQLGCKVVEISALKGTGIMEAADAAIDAAKNTKTVPMHNFSGAVEHAIAHIEEAAVHNMPAEQQRWYAIKIFEHDDKVLEKLDIPVEFIEGLRYTSADIMRVVEMVLVGQVNTELVGFINKLGGKAVGLSGVSGDIYHCHQRDEVHGYVGDVDYVDPKPIFAMLDAGYIPVVAPVGTDGQGHTFNINGDTAAGKLASALGAEKLVILTDIEGLCNDIKVRDVISYLNIQDVKALKDKGTIAGGMIPKVDCCVQAIEEGVTSVNIIDGRKPHSVLYEAFTNEGTGTTIGTAQPSVGIKW